MKLNELKDNEGSRAERKRVGRGIASGTGKTCGSGQKGQKARSGVSIKGFEGGQMPLYRRLPKRGFNNPNAKTMMVLNIGKLQEAIDAKKLDAKKVIDEQMLVDAGVIRRLKDGVRLLARGEIKSKVTIKVTGASAGAIAAVEKAGGTVEVAVAKEFPAKKVKKA